MDIDQLKEQLLSDPEVNRMVAHRAYEIYLERRGQRAAHPAEDWLRAESEVLPRLIDQMIRHNEQVIAAQDASSPSAHRAAAHMELELASSGVGERSPEAKAATAPLHEENVAALAATSDDDDTVPNASGVLDGEPVKHAKASAAKTAPSKPAAKKAVATPAAKPAAKPAAEKKPAAKKAPAKPAAKKAAAKPAAKPAAKKPAAKKAPAKPKKGE